MQKEKRTIIISLISGLILLVLASLYSELTREIYLDIGEFITYKWLINTIVLLFLIIALILYYYNNISKEIFTNPSIDTSKTSKKEISINEKNNDLKEIKDSQKYILENLSKDEKALLLEYIDHDTKTREFHYQDGVALGLKSTKVIYPVSVIMHFSNPVLSYNIQPWAWEMLKKNPRYLK